MVIPTRRNERCLRAVPLHEFETEDTAVKPQCPLQVSDLQVNVTDANARMDGLRTFHVSIQYCLASKSATLGSVKREAG
jgi:hypothetical protein